MYTIPPSYHGDRVVNINGKYLFDGGEEKVDVDPVAPEPEPAPSPPVEALDLRIVKVKESIQRFREHNLLSTGSGGHAPSSAGPSQRPWLLRREHRRQDILPYQTASPLLIPTLATTCNSSVAATVSTALYSPHPPPHPHSPQQPQQQLREPQKSHLCRHEPKGHFPPSPQPLLPGSHLIDGRYRLLDSRLPSSQYMTEYLQPRDAPFPSVLCSPESPPPLRRPTLWPAATESFEQHHAMNTTRIQLHHDTKSRQYHKVPISSVHRHRLLKEEPPPSPLTHDPRATRPDFSSYMIESEVTRVYHHSSDSSQNFAIRQPSSTLPPSPPPALPPPSPPHRSYPVAFLRPRSPSPEEDYSCDKYRAVAPSQVEERCTKLPNMLKVEQNSSRMLPPPSVKRAIFLQHVLRQSGDSEHQRSHALPPQSHQSLHQQRQRQNVFISDQSLDVRLGTELEAPTSLDVMGRSPSSAAAAWRCRQAEGALLSYDRSSSTSPPRASDKYQPKSRAAAAAAAIAAGDATEVARNEYNFTPFSQDQECDKFESNVPTRDEFPLTSPDHEFNTPDSTEAAAAGAAGDPSKSRRGRPRKHAVKIPLPPLYIFIRNMLHSCAYNPRVVIWVNESSGVFKVTNTSEFARTWGLMKRNRSEEMTYEKMSRAMRYHYGNARQGRRGHLAMVKEKRLVYRFGELAVKWRKGDVEKVDCDVHDLCAGSLCLWTKE